jgi:hypothetical protein
VTRALAAEVTAGPFRKTALELLTPEVGLTTKLWGLVVSPSDDIQAAKPKVAVEAAMLTARTWGGEPTIRVAMLDAWGKYNEKTKEISVHWPLVKIFESAPSREDYQRALEMTIMHELLHWVIHRCGGSFDHSNDRDSDPIYRFEKEAYVDAAVRHRTLGQMNEAYFNSKREMELKRWVRK